MLLLLPVENHHINSTNGNGFRRRLEDDALLSLREAADYLGYSVPGLRKIIRNGGLRYFQNGKGACLKFRREWLDDFIESRSRENPGTQPDASTRKRKKFRPELFRGGDNFGFDPELFNI